MAGGVEIEPNTLMFNAKQALWPGLVQGTFLHGAVICSGYLYGVIACDAQPLRTD